MKTIEELKRWIDGAREEFVDPSEPINQIFCKWTDALCMYRGEELVAGKIDGQICLRIGPGDYLPLAIESGGQGTIDREGLPRYGANAIAIGVWSLAPALYLPGRIHVFVTLYNVPLIAPWESRSTPAQRLYDFNTRFGLRES